MTKDYPQELGRISFALDEASAATGVTVDAMTLAIRAGQLRAKRQPLPNGKPNQRGKYVVFPEELRAWLDGWPDA